MKYQTSNSPKLTAFWAQFRDSDDIVTTGKFADKLTRARGQIVALLRSKSRAMPAALTKVEAKYIDRMEWPRSQVKMSVYEAALKTFAREHTKVERPNWHSFEQHLDRLKANGFDHPFFPSRQFEFDVTGLDLNKSAGLPSLNKKRTELNSAKMYWEKIEQNPSTPTWPLLAGLKTETAEPGITKPRVFLIRPACEWYGEIKYLRDAIKQTSEMCKGNTLRKFSAYYADFDVLHRFYKENVSDCQQVVVLDATQFGANITSQELEDVTRWFVHGESSHGIEHMVEYSTSSPILSHLGLSDRKGGLADGSVITNLGDTAIMDEEIWDGMESIKLDNRISGSLGNGDDKLLFMDTVMTSADVGKLNKVTDRDFNPDKTWLEPDTAWFSKLLWTPDLWTTSIALTYNRLKYMRRTKIAAEDEFKGYVAVRTAANFEYIRNHPLASDFRDIVRKIDKYPIDSLDDAIVDRALVKYRSENTWLADMGIDAQLADIKRNSFYASG